MNLYLVEYFVIMLNVCLSHGLGYKAKKAIYIVTAIQLILIVILRSPIDGFWPDTENYLNTFKYFNSYVSFKQICTTGWEPGIVLLVKLISIVSVDEQIYIVVLGLLILIPIFIMIWKECDFPILGLLVFYSMGCLFVTSIYRQWLAIAILAWSLRYVYRRDLKKFLLFLLIAFTFHRTAIVFLGVYFLYNYRISGAKLIVAMISSAILGSTGRFVLMLANRFARMQVVAENNGGYILLLVLWVCVLVSYFYMKTDMKNPKVRLPFNIVLFAAVIQPISFTFSLWSRIVIYFSMYLVLLLPQLISAIKSSISNEGAWFVIENAFMIVMLGWFIQSRTSTYIPFFELK